MIKLNNLDIPLSYRDARKSERETNAAHERRIIRSRDGWMEN